MPYLLPFAEFACQWSCDNQGGGLSMEDFACLV